MKIYKVKRTDDIGYDEYDAFVCVAPDMETAKNIKPGYRHGLFVTLAWDEQDGSSNFDTWTCDKNAVKVELLGIADATFDKTQILLASFNAG